ncbi:MAG: vitamin B12-dependent ribonucleotide reductase [Epulopiscium sp.]|nr:vitamin B12-dependent ribonucleotide reductase [Candidatus Epulonipiscium sp.]
MMELSNLIIRHFTTELEKELDRTVYDLFEWKQVDVYLKDYSTGKIIFDMKNLEFPSHYSQSACDIIASKYFRKKGVPNERGYEYSLKQIVDRMVSFWVESAWDEKLITTEQKSIVYDELAYMMLAQMWAPNSPQWFNTGLKMAYDIDGPPQGHYYYDPTTKQSLLSKDAYTRTQGSACFIVSVEDSLLGEKSLTDQVTTETRLFKYGSGVGSNWSSIRSKDEPLSGGGKSSGLLSFLKVFDRNAGAIKSGGTTRRAAKMNVLDLDHPEVLDFIQWKAKEENKAIALGKMGYSTDFDGEAYDTVSGQNANNSVRIPDVFMKVIDKPEAAWILQGRVDPSIKKSIAPSVLWNEIAKSAWRCGDPGVQYDDTINAWHTCPAGEDGNLGAKYNRINASNPCSEYMFLDDTACNLASINIVEFYDIENNQFDIEGYLHCIAMVQIVLEATIHWGQFPTPDIARKSYLFRTTGLGLTNLGMLFMLMAIPYDSNESRNIAASLMSLLTGYSYYVSALFAKQIGAFPAYELNRESMQKVLTNHAIVAGHEDENVKLEGLNYIPMLIDHKLLIKLNYQILSQQLKTVWQDTLALGKNYGYRNAQVSVLAPTGTIAFAMDCATTSSEPFFSHVAYKKLVGGGSMEIVNPAIPQALKKLNYTSEQIEDIIGYVMRKENVNGYEMIADGKIEGAPHLKDEHLPIFDTANRCGTGSRYISPEGHVYMMGALTPHVSGAISKTVNLPHDATVEDIKNIYQLSWKLGVKAIALYRDGCKISQPLNTAINNETEQQLEDYTYAELLNYAKKQNSKSIRVKPKGIRAAHVHEAEIAGLKLYITTSFYEDGRLGEIYVTAGRQGSLVKGLLDSLSTTISKMLQYGVPATDIARMYRGQKYEPSGFVNGHPYIKSVDSISDLISKIIDIELGDYTYCQVKPTTLNHHASSSSLSSVHENAGNSSYNEITKTFERAEVIYGEVCPHCKSTRMIKNGTCKVCTECGTTTGCS